MNNAQLIHQDSGNVEYYTPRVIVEAARIVLRDIDLDPASSHIANQRVMARTIFTVADDGLSQRWFGKIWMNHPFSRQNNPLWIDKLVSEYRSGNVEQAIMICFAAVNSKWFAPLFDYPMCFPQRRVNYINGYTGKIDRGVTKDSVIVYLGNNRYRFGEYFSPLGRIMLPT
jgi:hypothetical protein